MTMRRISRRVLALLLALCMTLALAPAALAADPDTNESKLEEAAKAAGFDYVYKSTYATMSASVDGGKATSKALTPTSPDSIKGDRGVYAAVLPLEGSDTAVRFCRATASGTSYTVSYAMPECSQFAVMLVQPVIDGGRITISTSISVSGSNYVVGYSATLNMSDVLAEIAAVNMDDSKMDNLRFTCYLTDPLVDSVSGITDGDITMTDISGIFELDGDSALQEVTGGWKATFKLKANWEDGLSAEQAKKNLMQAMTLTVASQTVAAGTLQGLVADNTLYTTGWLTITYNDGSGTTAIPGLGGKQTQITLPANLAEVGLPSTGSGGGGGGGATG